MNKSKPYHENLRDTYSKILREEIFRDTDLNQLSNDDLETLFCELTKWFGTSPPDTNLVKKDLEHIIESLITYSAIKEGDE